jgi:hypothetical protein
MSVTQLRRKRKLAIVATAVAGLVLTTAAALAASTPVPVKTGPRNEFAPAAGDDWFAWSQSRRQRPRLFDVFAQQTGRAAFKVNPKGTLAYTGGIDGATLVYQLIRGGLGVRPREVVDALKRCQPSERAVSAEAIVGLERGR